MEKRKHPRIPTSIPVFVKSISDSSNSPLIKLSKRMATIKNISEGGMLIVYKKDSNLRKVMERIKKPYTLKNSSCKLNLELTQPFNKILLNIETIPVWAEIQSDSTEDSVKLGIRFPPGTRIKPVVSDKTFGLFLDMPAKHMKTASTTQKVQETPPDRLDYQAARHYYRGVLFDSTGDYNTALKEFKRSLELGYENADIHNKLGKIYARENNYGQAITEFNKALEFNPLHIQAKYNLTNLKNKQKGDNE
jgi:tetratricopeptide (TPR) repeat protein